MTKEIELTGALHTIREALFYTSEMLKTKGTGTAHLEPAKQALTLIDQILEQVPDGLEYLNNTGDELIEMGLLETFSQAGVWHRASKLLNTITKGEE